jgi:hypothetical protein
MCLGDQSASAMNLKIEISSISVVQLTFLILASERWKWEHLSSLQQQVPGSEKRLVLTEDVNNGMHNMALL